MACKNKGSSSNDDMDYGYLPSDCDDDVSNYKPMLTEVLGKVSFQKVHCTRTFERVVQTAETSNLFSPESPNSASASNLVQSNDSYLPWNDYFMGLCFLTSARSKDPKTKVGACIVDQENRIISLGYNGMPRGIKDRDLPWIKQAEHSYETKYPYVCHAEMNAIMNGRNAYFEDCCLYVTKFPCAECAKLIIQAGIKHVVFAEKVPDPIDEQIPSRKMFTLAGVTCRKFIPSIHRLNLDMVDGSGSVVIAKE